MLNKQHRYPLAPNPIWWGIQGEGHLRGFQMAFVRLAGCSVGCEGCDTNYKVNERATAGGIVDRVMLVVPSGDRDRWVWITGGEPTDHDLVPLIREFKSAGFSVAVATSGSNRLIHPVDWLSVSPHGWQSAKFQQRYGQEIKIVDGLDGLSLETWHAAWPDSETDFLYRYVQPLWVGDAETGNEDRESIERCKEFLRKNPRWALSRQDHKHWRVA
jgi:7-carboxy-7-deazaguanine synthase